MNLASAWTGLTEANAARTVAMILTFDPALASRLAEDIQSTTARISTVQQSIEAMDPSGEEKAQMDKIANLHKSVLDASNLAQSFVTDSPEAASPGPFRARCRQAGRSQGAHFGFGEAGGSHFPGQGR